MAKYNIVPMKGKKITSNIQISFSFSPRNLLLVILVNAIIHKEINTRMDIPAKMKPISGDLNSIVTVFKLQKLSQVTVTAFDYLFYPSIYLLARNSFTLSLCTIASLKV